MVAVFPSTPMAMAQFSPLLSPLIHEMMKTYPALLSLMLFMACFTAVHAQDGRIPAPVSVTIDSYQSIQVLPQPSWVIKEGESPLSIQDILNGDIKDGQVLEINPDEIVIEQFEKYWFAIEFSSEVDLHNWLLYVENTFSGYGYSNNFSEIKSYALLNETLGASGMTGSFVPASKRDFKSRHTQSLLNLSLKSGSRLTLWINISKNYSQSTTFPKLSIYDPSTSLPEFPLEKRNFLLFGSFTVIWILALIMLFYLRDKTSIWFLIFTSLVIVDNITIWSSDPLTPLLYPENPQNGLYVGAWTSFLVVSILIQFSRVFIDLRLKHKKLDKIILGAVWILFFSSFILFHLTVHFENTFFFKHYMLTFIGIYLVSGAVYLFLNDPLSRFMGIGILVMISAQVIQIPFDKLSLAYAGVMVTVLLGVGYRIKILFKDRMQAENEKKDLLMHQNSLLENQVAVRTAELSHSLTELKATQSQLVQQEKLASLGQLTAGIAHEIKNPLNFVNNFTGVSLELIDEALEELEKGKQERDEILIKDNMVDIKSNLQKVHEHGTRANSIVSSMLLHSRGGSGKMEPTDLNALIQEYVNLSFHGMRAGKNPIEVDIQLDLDPGITDVPLIKEDFSRVVINLCNNAFDAMRGKTYEVPGTKYEVPDTKYETEEGNNVDYLPKLTVITSLEKGQVRIAIQDNGPGIPEEIKDKILQPFFTTKKGTEGTGLGLSITHDIIKAHGGSLSIESDPNGSIFTITIPTDS
jgi:signal transduction histidine kinase